MEIRIFKPPIQDGDPFVPVAVTFDAIDISYQKRFFTYGEFQIIIPASGNHANALQKYRLVHINKEFWGIILSVSRSLSSNGDRITVEGVDLKGITASRYTLPPTFSDSTMDGTAGFDAIQGTTETCMKHFMYSNFFTATSPTRRVPGLVIAPDLGRGISNDRYMSRYDPLSSVLEELGKAAELGYDIVPDIPYGTMIFDCICGTNRTAMQSQNPRMIFSVQQKNIESMEYQDSDKQMKNVFYATLSGSTYADEAYTATYTRKDEPLPSGLFRWEQHLDISASHPEAGKEYEELKRLAMIRGESYTSTQALTAVVTVAQMKGNNSFALGDIVTVQNQSWGLTMDTRITEIAMQASAGGVSYAVTFGEAPVNPIARLRRQIRGG